MSLLIPIKTKQHKNVYDILMKEGRYIVSADYAGLDMLDFRNVTFEAYDWLSPALAARVPKPSDTLYPVWVTPGDAGSYPADSSELVICLSVPADMIAFISIIRWSSVLNYSYLPENAEDALRHRREVMRCGTDDVRAVMTGFYPELKREIIGSWGRIFEEKPGKPGTCYGLMWELRREWVTGTEPAADFTGTPELPGSC